MKPTRTATSIFLMMTLLAVANSILIGFVPNLLEDQVEGRETYFWMALIGINAIIVGYSLREWRHANTATPTRSIDQAQANRNRQAMLEKVRMTWIAGVLDQSLYKETLITLGLQTRPDAVARPMDVLVQRPNHNDRALPLDKSIIQVYDDLNRAMLILGAPGAGKTTLLLDLTRDLLDRAMHDPTHPIPVVFPLSSWAEQRRPLADWLVDELNLRYDVPRKVAQAWIDDNAILPLLDGLDEVARGHRAACVDAINTFRKEKYGLLPLVVSSRVIDYDVLTVKLRLDGAIVVQPLKRAQVKSYLQQIGLRVAPSTASTLLELLDTPLMLNIATLTYAEPSGAAVQIQEVHQDQLFAAYVNRMFQRNSPHLRFSQRLTVHSLTWLAWQMQRHDQSIFYLERMQPAWLSHQQRWLMKLIVGLVVGLIGGLVSGLLIWLIIESGRGLGSGLGSGLGGGLVVGLVVGLIVGLVRGSLSEQAIKLIDAVRWSWTKILAGLGYGLIGGVGVFLMVTPLLGLTIGLSNGLGLGLVLGLLSGSFYGIAFGLLDGLSVVEVENRPRPNQGIHRSGQSALLVGLIVGLIVGSIGGLGGALLEFGPLFGPLFGLVIGLGAGLFFCLDFGGAAWLHHYVIRLLLVWQGVIPWRYVPFLDFAAQRILLRNVGGGYIFIHRLLLEYFAKQYTGPETAEVNATSKGT